jgi:sporulation protein YqfC
MAKGQKKLKPPGEMPRPGAAHIEMNGNTELFVEGCRGVIAYGEGEIRLDLGGLVLAVSGADLTMRTLRLEECVITGRIASAEFLN